MRRAKAAGIRVAFDHGGVAVLTLPEQKQPEAKAEPAAAGEAEKR